MKELQSRLSAAGDEDGTGLEKRTLARVRDTFGPERLASELAAGAALSLEEVVDSALGRDSSATSRSVLG
jgi:hypothetical protein